jgi:hypothetical protein
MVPYDDVCRRPDRDCDRRRRAGVDCVGLVLLILAFTRIQKTKIDIKKARQKWIKKYMKKFG